LDRVEWDLSPTESKLVRKKKEVKEEPKVLKRASEAEKNWD